MTQHSTRRADIRSRNKTIIFIHSQNNMSDQPTASFRISKACEECRRRKTRCNGLSPCSICRRYMTSCVYRQAKARPQRRRRLQDRGLQLLPATPNSAASHATASGPLSPEQELHLGANPTLDRLPDRGSTRLLRLPTARCIVVSAQRKLPLHPSLFNCIMAHHQTFPCCKRSIRSSLRITACIQHRRGMKR